MPQHPHEWQANANKPDTAACHYAPDVQSASLEHVYHPTFAPLAVSQSHHVTTAGRLGNFTSGETFEIADLVHVAS